MKKKEKPLESRVTLEVTHALDYMTTYFKYHAEQRIQILRYFIFYLAAVVLGLFKIFDPKNYHILGGLTILSLIITIIFAVLEYRNAQLVNIGKKGCMVLESILADDLKKKLKGRSNIKEIASSICPITQAERVKTSSKWRKFISYNYALALLYAIIFLLHFLVLFFAIRCWLTGICPA